MNLQAIMNRNVSIVIILLIFVVIAGYLIWIRSRYQPPVSPKPEEQIVSSPTLSPTPTASVSATPAAKEATGSMKAKTSTSSSTKK